MRVRTQAAEVRNNEQARASMSEANPKTSGPSIAFIDAEPITSLSYRSHLRSSQSRRVLRSNAGSKACSPPSPLCCCITLKKVCERAWLASDPLRFG
jgi:hypothetical protein